MSDKVIVISEWLPKANCEQEAFEIFLNLARKTLNAERGCLQYNVSKQMTHPNTTGPRNFKIMLMQEFKSIEDFDQHCAAPYVAELFDKLIANKNTSLIKNYECRAFFKAPLPQ
jgi:quinol monooxygenase YgiN